MEEYFCYYGCGKVALYQLKNGKFCCNKNQNSCSEVRKRFSIARKGKPSPHKGKNRIYSSEAKKKMGDSRKGKLPWNIGLKTGISWNRGKKGIFSNEAIEKIRKSSTGRKHSKKFKDNQSKRMRNGGSVHASSFIKNPSIPQVELYNSIKDLYSSSILNYPLYELNYSLDIAIPELKIWFESDGSWWHQDKEKDLERQKKIENLGWKCIRYEIDYTRDVPSKYKISNDIENLMKG